MPLNTAEAAILKRSQGCLRTFSKREGFLNPKGDSATKLGFLFLREAASFAYFSKNDWEVGFLKTPASPFAKAPSQKGSSEI